PSLSLLQRNGRNTAAAEIPAASTGESRGTRAYPREGWVCWVRRRAECAPARTTAQPSRAPRLPLRRRQGRPSLPAGSTSSRADREDHLSILYWTMN
uniref:Uncharacterized protein n=1 Tax=Triticum urartu TaxID=4572 RepID=A0A8R7K597_TRIUA